MDVAEKKREMVMVSAKRLLQYCWSTTILFVQWFETTFGRQTGLDNHFFFRIQNTEQG